MVLDQTNEIDLVLHQGAQEDFAWDVYDSAGNLVDLSGCTAKVQVAISRGATPLFTLTVGSGITLNSPTGRIAISFSSAQTAQLTFERYRWDLLFTDSL